MRGLPRCAAGRDVAAAPAAPAPPPALPHGAVPPGLIAERCTFFFPREEFFAGPSAWLDSGTVQPGQWDRCLPGLGQILGIAWGHQGHPSQEAANRPALPTAEGAFSKTGPSFGSAWQPPSVS